jgi:hypothetical protein
MVAIEGLAPAHAALARAARAEIVPAVRPSCSSATRPPGCCESHFSVLIPGGELGAQYRHTLPQLRWFWSITVYVDPALGVTTKGRVPTLEAKARFCASWSRVSEAREQKERQQP